MYVVLFSREAIRSTGVGTGERLDSPTGGARLEIALSGDDDKRIIREDGIHTLAYGHYSIG
jgi:hypothetical protein